MEVTFHGLEQLASNFRRLSTAARAEGEKALKTGGMLIVAEAQKNLRKQPNSNNTGALAERCARRESSHTRLASK